MLIIIIISMMLMLMLMMSTIQRNCLPCPVLPCLALPYHAMPSPLADTGSTPILPSRLSHPSRTVRNMRFIRKAVKNSHGDRGARFG